MDDERDEEGEKRQHEERETVNLRAGAEIHERVHVAFELRELRSSVETGERQEERETRFEALWDEWPDAHRELALSIVTGARRRPTDLRYRIFRRLIRDMTGVRSLVSATIA